MRRTIGYHIVVTGYGCRAMCGAHGRLGFQASSDHISTHISYCNVWVEEPTREGILAAIKARHVYGATDNIIADVRCGERFMGDEFTVDSRPSLSIRLTATQPFAKVHVIKDGNYVRSASPGKKEVQFDWTDFDARPGQLLLRPRGAGERRTGVGLPDVDHVRALAASPPAWPPRAKRGGTMPASRVPTSGLRRALLPPSLCGTPGGRRRWPRRRW